MEQLQDLAKQRGGSLFEAIDAPAAKAAAFKKLIVELQGETANLRAARDGRARDPPLGPDRALQERARGRRARGEPGGTGQRGAPHSRRRTATSKARRWIR
jgi:hypothetical protein